MPNLFRLWKTVSSTPHFLRIATVTLFVGILSFGFWLRIKGVPNLPDQQFTSNDAYLFYSQAQTISKHGYLPERDMQRWLPIGRDNRQFLSLYPSIIAWTHKAITLFFHKVTLYQVQVYAPAVCFTLGLVLLLIFLTVNYGSLFAAIVGVLLATIPSSIARSAAGFSDRDAWCWMLAIFLIISYLWKEQMQPGHRRTLATVLCGFIVFLGGLSWEAFGIFVLIILSAEIWKFCTTDAEENLKEYLIWVIIFVPGLYLISPSYRSGYGFSTHVATLLLAPPVVLLTLRSIRWLLLRCITQFRLHAQKLAFGLILIGIAAGVIYVLGQYKTFPTTAYPFIENRLMKSVSELADPDFMYWVNRYGGTFVLGGIGIIATAHHYWKQKALILTIGVTLLCTTIFLRIPMNGWIGENWCNRLFLTSLPLTVIGFGYVMISKQEKQLNECPYLIAIVWFFIWAVFTRGGARHGFFISTPLAIGTAVIIKYIAAYSNPSDTPIKLFNQNIHPKLITTGLVAGILGILLFWGPVGGYAKSTLRLAASQDAIPGNANIGQAYNWIKNELPHDTTIMAAHWENGSQLNVHARVRTITDQDHFIPHWIHLYFRHVYCAQSELEALYFLKTHGATHLMITSVELVAYAHENSLVGSDADHDRLFDFHQMLSIETPPEIQYSLLLQRKRGYLLTTLNRIDIVGTDLENLTITAKFGKEDPIQLPYLAFYGDKRISSEHLNTERGGLVLIFDKKKVLRSSFYVPEVGWNSLVVKLFIRGEHSEVFDLVHTVPTYGPGTHPDIQIWKINYPENIKPHPKYLVPE